MLNALWKLCHYSIKATTFAGLYVDGDRERIPYEADAYLNQLGHQACHHDCAIARATFDYLLAHPTWPTEWASHMPFMAYADWMYTGDREWIAERFEALEAKLMFERIAAGRTCRVASRTHQEGYRGFGRPASVTTSYSLR